MMNQCQISRIVLALAAAGFLMQPCEAAQRQLSSLPYGSVVVWGSNSRGQLNVPSGLDDAVAIAAGLAHSLALRRDGTVVAWGDNESGGNQSIVPPGLSDVVAIRAGPYSSYALKSDGTVVGWGADGGMETIPEDLSDVIDIEMNIFARHALALRRDGTVVAWGYRNDDFWDRDTRAIKAVPPGLTDVVAIASGRLHSVALRQDGTVVAWGQNHWTSDVGWSASGQTSVPSGLRDVVAIVAGVYHSLALRSDGTVEAWGESWAWDQSHNQPAVPSGLRDVIAIGAVQLASVALTRDGTVVAWGNNSYSFVTAAPGSIGARAIAGGNYHALALKDDGTVVAWGYNRSGRSDVPEGLGNVIAIAAGAHSLAIVAAPGPRLEVEVSGPELRLAWAETASDYRLQVTDDLSSPNSWTVEPTAPVLEDSGYVLTIPLGGSHGRFYRLMRE